MAPTVVVPMSRPAPTMTSKSPGQWVFHRPATCVMGDPRIAAPGYRGGHDDRSTTMMADAIRVTIDEALILQGFRPDYPVQGSRTKQFLQVGNAVCPPVAAAVLRDLAGRAEVGHSTQRARRRTSGTFYEGRNRYGGVPMNVVGLPVVVAHHAGVSVTGAVLDIAAEKAALLSVGWSRSSAEHGRFAG